jgi:dTDP-4-dehydrorhamnose 3,5-epimerase
MLRGLHYQILNPLGKLVRVTAGEVYDVPVEMRRSSLTFGQWVGFTLSTENKHVAWIPPGFSHGFCVVSGSDEFLYKTTDYWYPEFERSLLSNDPVLSITWPNTDSPTLTAKDAAGVSCANAEFYEPEGSVSTVIRPKRRTTNSVGFAAAGCGLNIMGALQTQEYNLISEFMEEKMICN